MSRPYPRPARPEDEEALRECVGRVFRPSLYDEYPQLFHAGNLPHCRVIELDGKIVSHVGLTIQDASILGCAVRVGCIGAVATLPEYRGKGYASACLIDAMLHARAQGCDWLIISGDRSLYRRVGARRVGRDFHVRMSAEQAEGLRDPKVHLRRASREDIPLLMELHQREPVHWKRSVRVWGRAFDCAFVMNRPASFWIVERAGIPQGYLILQEVREPGRGPIAEAAGDWNLLIPAFAELIHRRGFQTVDWHLYSVDRIGRELARSAGLRVEEAMASGTVVVLNFPQAVRRLWPLLVERAPELAEVPISLLSHTPRQRGVWETSGVREAEEVSEAEEVWDAEGIGKATYVIRLGEEAYSLPDRGAVAHLLFGTREPSNLPPLPEGRLGELLRAALPVPALWYGVNYV